MAFYVLLGLVVVIALVFAWESRKDIGEALLTFCGITFFGGLFALLVGMCLMIVSYSWSDFKPKSTASYEIIADSFVGIRDGDVKVIVKGADGIPAEKIFFASNYEVTGDSKITVDTWERTAPGWVPWVTGVTDFVKVS